MGTGYTYRCKTCGHSFSAYLGVGFLYPRLYQDVMTSARKGNLGKQAKRFLEENPYGAIDPKTVIAQCEDCGNYDAVMDLSMYVPKEGQPPRIHKGNWTISDFDPEAEYVFEFDEYDLKELYEHRCTLCKGRLHILKEQEPELLKCPKCGDDMIIEDVVMWD